MERLDACADEEAGIWSTLATKSDFPLTAMFSLTERCPFSCPHCFLRGFPARRSEELRTAEVISLLDELAQLGFLKISFTGGEVGLRNDLVEIVAAAASRHFVVSVKSTGILFSENDVSALVHAGAHNLTVTFLHDDPERHDGFMGHAGAFEKAVAAARCMVRLGGRVHVTIPVMEWNIEAVPALVTWCESQGFHPLFDLRIFQTLMGSPAPQALRATDAQMQKLLADTPPERRGTIERRSHDRICSAGSTDVHFCSNGDVWPCTMLPVRLGNVREEPFATIWQHSEALAAFRKLRWGDCADCGSCEMLEICGRCPADAYLEHGDITQHSSQDCHLATMRFRT